MKQELSIQELWQRICDCGSDDDSAVEAFILRLDGAVRSKCRINGVVNEDLVQEVRTRLYRQIKDYQKKSNEK